MSFEIGTFFTEDETKTYEVIEGNITIDNGLDLRNGVRKDFMKFANEVKDNTFLEFSKEELSMQPVSAGGEATHICAYEPEFPAGFMPKEAMADGTYTRRIVGCSGFRDGREYRLPLNPKNIEIKAGDALELIDAYTGLDKSTKTSTTVRALENVPANAGQELIYVYLSEPKIPVKTTV